MRLDALEDSAEGMDEVHEADFRKRHGGEFGEFLWGEIAREKRFLQFFAFAQNLSRFLEFSVFDELADELPSRVVFLRFLLGGLLVLGEEGSAFNVHEGGGHDKEVPGDFEVELAHRLQILEVIVDDFLDKDLVNIYLVLFDEVEEKVEGTFKDLEVDFEGIIGRHNPKKERLVQN